MSFAYDVKAELCKVPINRSCCAVAEGCGVLLYASAFTANEVRIVTENDEFAARLPKLFQKAFSLRFDELPDKSKDGGKLVFRITQEDKLDTIWRALGYDRRAHFALHLNFARGIFVRRQRDRPAKAVSLRACDLARAGGARGRGAAARHGL